MIKYDIGLSEFIKLLLKYREGYRYMVIDTYRRWEIYLYKERPEKINRKNYMAGNIENVVGYMEWKHEDMAYRYDDSSITDRDLQGNAVEIKEIIDTYIDRRKSELIDDMLGILLIIMIALFVKFLFSLL